VRVGIAYDLKSDLVAEAAAAGASLPEDAFEEYDSEETVEAIAGALRAAGHEPLRLGGGRRFLERLLALVPGGGGTPGVDLVFNIAEGRGTRSREAHVPAACEMLGVPVTHSDPLTLALTLDKALTKRVVAHAGVPTGEFALVERAPDLERAALPPFPVIAKPNWEGSSMGVRRRSKCRTPEELRERVAALLAEYRQPVLVEKFLVGAEVTVGVLGNGERAAVAGMLECAPRIARQEEFIYSLEVKRNWREEVEYHVPPRLPPATLAAIERVALGAYRALGCRDVARVDVRLDETGAPRFIEVNPLPGINPVTGDLCILAARSGIPYERLIARVVEEALTRIEAARAAAAG
jgi:D-alanine-D-alanine ligase